MSENKEFLEKCDFCFTLIAYLHGSCPVCNDTGFVQKKVREPVLLGDEGYANHLRKLTNPGDAIR